MPGETLGEGFVLIRPDMTAFTPELEAKIKGSLAAINTAGTQNPLENAFAGSASGAVQLDKAVAGAASTVQQKAVPAMKTLGDTTKKATESVNGASTSVSGLQRSVLALAKLAPVLAAAFSVKLFSDFEKASREAAVVFGDSSQEIIDFANHIDAQFGLTSTAALRFATDFGNALQGIGFSQKVAADASEALTNRTVDVAAALAKTPAQIANAFNLALEGNTRGLKQLGITITAVDLQNRALQLGFKGTTSELSDAQRATVLYSLLLDKTDKFQGQAAATAGTFAGQLRDFKASVGDAAIAIGRDLAPGVEALLGVLTPVAKLIGDIPAPILAFAAAAGITAAAITAISASAIPKFVTGLFGAEGAIGGFVAELGAAEGVAATFGVVVDAALGPIALISLALGAAAAIFTTTKPKIDEAAQSLQVFNDIIDKTGNALREAALADLAKELAKPEISDALKGAQVSVGDFAQAVLGGNASVQGMVNRLIELHGEGKITDDQFNTLYGSVFNLSTQFTGASATSANLAAIEKELGIEAAGTNDSLKAQTTALNDLFTVTDNLTRANRSLTEATAAQTTAEQKVKDLRVEGGKQEVADATTHLAEARDSLTGALERQAIAQKTLDDLNAPATDRELSDAADAVTEAQIKAAQATRARDEALKALNKTQTKAIDLTGLSLDQLRTTLANARATLSAQRQGTKGAKTPAELQEDATQAEIDLRKANEAVADAQTKLNDLKAKGTAETDKTIAAEHELTLANNAVTKAQDEVNARAAKLADLTAGNTQNAKLLATAVKDVQTATDRVHDAQKDINDLTAKQLDDTNTILGVKRLITAEEQQQIRNQAVLFARNADLRRGLVENLLLTQGATLQLPIGPGLPGGTKPFAAGALSQSQVDQVFAALTGDPNKLIALLKSIGLNVPGFAGGGTVTSPTLAWIGEKFRPETVVPWSNTERVWSVLSQSLPHMPTTVRQRLEPVIPTSRVSAPTHLNRPVADFDYDRMAQAIARALRESGAGADVDINVTAPPGMSEAQLARRIRREMEDRSRG